MSKIDRSKTEEVYVCGFVPSYALPNKTPCALDPFLHPIMTEIEEAFINGKYIVSYIYMYSSAIWLQVTYTHIAILLIADAHAYITASIYYYSTI